MKDSKIFVTAAIVALLLASNIGACGAMPIRGPPPPIGNRYDEDILQAYMAFTSDAIYYMSMREKAYDTEEFMALGSRLAIIEDLIVYTPRLESSLKCLKSIARNAGGNTILDAMTQRSTSILVGNGEFSALFEPYMIDGSGLISGLESIDVMLEYDKEGLIEYAASIYSKQLSLGRALKGLDIYLDELAERYEHSRKCLSIGMTAASFSVVSLGSKIPYSSFLPSPDGGSDSDKDGLADYLEDCLGTDIWLADTDNDGLSDYDEVYRYLSDPLDRDTDNDGLTDGEEAQRGTDPNRNETIYLPIDNPFYSVDDDTDEDGISDIKEVSMGTNMLLQDTDHDGISDGSECELGLDPLSADTDGDGFDDLKDLYPLDPEKGEGGINFHDDEELLMIMYGAIAVGATVASFFGCSSCASIAIKATIQIIELYDMEMEERRKGIDE